MSSRISIPSKLRAGLVAMATAGLLGGSALLAATPPASGAAAPNGASPSGAAANGSAANGASRGSTRPRSGPPRPRTLFNLPDPTLTLTPPLGGSRTAPPGSAPPNPDPHDFEGVWQVQGYEYLLGPEPGVPPPLKPKYIKLLEKRIRAKNRG